MWISDWGFLLSRKAETYTEKLVRGMVMTTVVLTTIWTGLAVLVPEITVTIFLGGLLIVAGIAVFMGQFMAWDG